MTITNNTGSDLAAVETITVVIDGVAVEVPKGTLVIRAAELIGTEIPRFCDHPLLEPVAACRACLIEVEGMPKPQPACAQVVSDGMVIRTQNSSTVAAEAQAGVMEFLLLNHPLDCPVCDKGGECPLQNQAMAVGRPESRFTEEKRTFEKPINVSAQILLDRERCVSCARCTRFADQIAGDAFIDLLERGSKQQVGTADDQPFDSYFSGNTVQICPVGALTSSAYRFRSRPFDLVSVPTTCEHCASGCSLRTDYRRGVVTRRLAWDDPEALNVAAEGLRKAGTAVGVLVGGRATVEDAYAYQRFARVALGSDHLDFRVRANSDEEAAFLKSAVAGSPVRTTYSDLESAPAVLLVAFEPEDESPIVFLRLRKAAAARTKVLSVAATATRGLEKMKGTWIPAAPGAEAGVLGALDAAVLDQLRQPGAVILVGERIASIVGGASAVQALATSTGAALAWVPRRAGERGALDAGALAGLLPLGRPLTDAAARSEVAAAWGVSADSLPTQVGLSGEQLLLAAKARTIRAIISGGVDLGDFANPVLAREAFESTGFVLSLENHHSSVTAIADVVLPVAVVTEKSGTFINWEGRPRPFGEVLRDALMMSDAAVLGLVAQSLGANVGASDVPSLRRQMASLGAWQGSRESAPSLAPAAAAGGVALATWRYLLDEGSLQADEPHLAATARTAAAIVSAVTAASLGNPAEVIISGPTGAIALPLEVGNVVDNAVVLPMNSAGCVVTRDLGAGYGEQVSLRAGGAA